MDRLDPPRLRDTPPVLRRTQPELIAEEDRARRARRQRWMVLALTGVALLGLAAAAYLA